jgi:hypothetical protein
MGFLATLGDGLIDELRLLHFLNGVQPRFEYVGMHLKRKIPQCDRAIRGDLWRRVHKPC